MSKKPVLERPPIRKMTAAQAAAFEAAKVDRTAPINLSPADRKAVDDAVAVTNTLLLNAMLHRFDKRAYPVGATAGALEKSLVKHVAALPEKAFARLVPGMAKLTADPAKRKRYLRHLSPIELNKPGVSRKITRLKKVKRAKPEPKVKISKPEPEPKTKRPTVRVTGSPELEWSALHFHVRALHCVNETDPEGGTDDMVVGGALIGAGGNVVPAKAFVGGEFESGDLSSYGNMPFGVFSLKSKKDYPKTYYVIFQLVESDSDDKEVAAAITTTVRVVAATVISALASPAVAAIADAVIQAIGSFIGMFLDEDEFPPYALWLRQEGPTKFKTNGGVTWNGPESPNLRTDDIRGHGGRYRIGYRWALA
jgi:hypothetical protein